MKTVEIFGLISGLLVVLSVVPYSIRTWQGKIQPNITTWTLWTFVGLAMLLTYKSSGAESNVWPAVFGFFNPLVITILAIRSKGKVEKPNKVEIKCILVVSLALVMWFFTKEDKSLVRYALYAAIAADACAAIPTIFFLWINPHEDRPFAWGLVAIGYGIGMFAIEDNTFANYALPAYMFLGASGITSILSIYRIRKKISLKEWI